MIATAARAFRPVSRHPLFPIIVALWFAALFGLCSLALRPALLEALIQASGIGRIIPAAAPPLGMTGRLLIALALALAGGLLGAILGRVLASRPPVKGEISPRRRDSHPDAPSPRPVSAHAELGESPLPDLSMTAVAADEDISAALDSADAAPDQERDDNDEAIECHRTPDAVSLELVHLPKQHDLQPAAPPLGKAAQRIVSADLATLTPIELVERLGIAMQRRRASMDAAPAPASLPPPPFPRVYFTPPARIDNERILRSALATLQKVSGAA